jgi:hypothetical protein
MAVSTRSSGELGLRCVRFAIHERRRNCYVCRRRQPAARARLRPRRTNMVAEYIRYTAPTGESYASIEAYAVAGTGQQASAHCTSMNWSRHA